MSLSLAARSACAAEPINRAATAPTAAAVVLAAVASATAPLTPPATVPSGGTAAGRVGLAVPLARSASHPFPMDDTLKILAAVSSSVGVGQMLLFWVTRRSHKVDARDEKELSLESSFLAERRELLASLRAQLAAEEARGSRLETEKTALLRELIALQRFANEVVAKYDFLRTLNPAANLPTINLDPSAVAAATPNPEASDDPRP